MNQSPALPHLPGCPVAAVLFVAATVLHSVVAPAVAQDRLAEPIRRITVTGVGEASAKPDLAATALTVLRMAPTAGAALDEANTAMAAVVSAMKALGIAPRDFQTSGFQIMPQYRYDNAQDGTQAPPTLVGYEVRNSLSLRIRDLAAVGRILDKAVTLGINEGSGIQFTIDDPASLRSEARRKAVNDATTTAAALAEAAGVPLGPVVSIDASSEMPQPVPMMARMSLAAAPKADETVPVEAGENTVNASVRMVFAIGDGR